MKYNFDEILVRKGTGCVKHDMMMRDFGRNDLLPMWVADMDFRSPDFVMQALRERCEHEVLGYPYAQRNYYNTMCQWLLHHYNIEATRAEIHFIPGIVSGISFALQALTHEGDRVLITTPVYPPFIHLPMGSGRQLVCSPLKVEGGRFVFDFDDLECQAPHCKLLILSNPHNPAGAVWSADELRRLADICHRNHVIVIADEIHADLTLPGHQHTSFSTVSPEARDCSITFIAPSKTFNIAGLGSSIGYIPNTALRERFFGYLDTFEVANGNIFAFVGAEAAFRLGEDWLRQLLDYLEGNVDFLKEYLEQHLPLVKAMLPEASYLAWLDFSDYGYTHTEMRQLLIDTACVALNDGATFAPLNSNGKPDKNCENHFRLNIGCPRATLEEALNRIKTIEKKQV